MHAGHIQQIFFLVPQARICGERLAVKKTFAFLKKTGHFL
jgi:hypothetical protein